MRSAAIFYGGYLGVIGFFMLIAYVVSDVL